MMDPETGNDELTKKKNRYQAFCRGRKLRGYPIPTEAEYSEYRESHNAGKKLRIAPPKKKEKPKRAIDANEKESAGTFTERVSVVIARVNARAKAMCKAKAQGTVWSA